MQLLPDPLLTCVPCGAPAGKAAAGGRKVPVRPVRSHSETWRTKVLPLGTTSNSKPSLITSTYSSVVETLVLVEVLVDVEMLVDVELLLDVWMVLPSSTTIRMLSILIWWRRPSFSSSRRTDSPAALCATSNVIEMSVNVPAVG